jgi:SAM-dependent methyltransferase
MTLPSAAKKAAPKMRSGEVENVVGTTRPCPICDEKTHEQLYRRRFTKLSGALLDGYDVVWCPTCGFCFADGLPSQSDLDTYYEGQSKYEHDSRSGAPSEYDTRRLPFAVSIISAWLPDRDARILDIGCANGALLAELRKNGFKDVMGIDPSSACARTAKDLYGINVEVAPISRIPANIGLFDLVIFGSVMEHILDLNGTIQRIKRLLKPNGHVYVEVPDMTRGSSVNDAPFQEFSVEHINFFGPMSLENLWHKHGFVTTGIRQTEIEQVAGLTIFEIKAMFAIEEGQRTAAMSFDTQTKPEIERYISLANSKLKKIEEIINELADSQRPIVVWGVGTHTQGLLASTRLREANIKAFVDSNARYAGQSLIGVPIRPIDDLKTIELPILISSQQFQEEIASTVRDKLHLPNPLITLYDPVGQSMPGIQFEGR